MKVFEAGGEACKYNYLCFMKKYVVKGHDDSLIFRRKDHLLYETPS